MKENITTVTLRKIYVDQYEGYSEKIFSLNCENLMLM